MKRNYQIVIQYYGYHLLLVGLSNIPEYNTKHFDLLRSNFNYSFYEIATKKFLLSKLIETVSYSASYHISVWSEPVWDKSKFNSKNFTIAIKAVWICHQKQKKIAAAPRVRVDPGPPMLTSGTFLFNDVPGIVKSPLGSSKNCSARKIYVNDKIYIFVNHLKKFRNVRLFY